MCTCAHLSILRPPFALALPSRPSSASMVMTMVTDATSLATYHAPSSKQQPDQASPTGVVELFACLPDVTPAKPMPLRRLAFVSDDIPAADNPAALIKAKWQAACEATAAKTRKKQLLVCAQQVAVIGEKRRLAAEAVIEAERQRLAAKTAARATARATAMRTLTLALVPMVQRRRLRRRKNSQIPT